MALDIKRKENLWNGAQKNIFEPLKKSPGQLFQTLDKMYFQQFTC